MGMSEGHTAKPAASSPSHGSSVRRFGFVVGGARRSRRSRRVSPRSRTSSARAAWRKVGGLEQLLEGWRQAHCQLNQRGMRLCSCTPSEGRTAAQLDARTAGRQRRSVGPRDTRHRSLPGASDPQTPVRARQSKADECRLWLGLGFMVLERGEPHRVMSGRVWRDDAPVSETSVRRDGAPSRIQSLLRSVHDLRRCTKLGPDCVSASARRRDGRS